MTILRDKLQQQDYIFGAITLTAQNIIDHWKKHDLYGVGYRLIFIRDDARRGYDMVCPEERVSTLRLLNGAKSLFQMGEILGAEYREQRGIFMNLWFCLRALMFRLTLKEQQSVISDLKHKHFAWVEEEWVK